MQVSYLFPGPSKMEGDPRLTNGRRSMKKLFLLALSLFLLITQIAFAADIKDSESATHDSDSSTYRIVDTYSFPDFKVIQFTLPVLSVYSYLLVSDREALLVDPVRDISFFWLSALLQSPLHLVVSRIQSPSSNASSGYRLYYHCLLN
jgi:hypothetical protein